MKKRKILGVCLTIVLLLQIAPMNVSALQPPRYPAPIFYCKSELIRNLHPQAWEQGRVLLPVITDDRITFLHVDGLNQHQRDICSSYALQYPIFSIKKDTPRVFAKYTLNRP